MSFADNLVAGMRRHGFTSHAKLAKEVGVSRPAVTQWAAGKSQPRGETLRRVARALNTTVAALLDEAGPSSEQPADALVVVGQRGPQGSDLIQDADEAAIIRFWRSLSETKRRAFIRLALDFASAPEAQANQGSLQS